MDIKIEKLIYGGDGLAHYDAATVFVPFVLPGETVSVVPIEKKKKFLRARAEAILSPAPERIAPRCPYFLSCGGCHYQHIPYESQLKYKEEILRETLRRLGKIDWSGPIEAHASPAWGYRNRAQWKVREQKSGGPPQIGYFHAASTALVPVDECPIVSPKLVETLNALRGLLASGGLSPALREVEAFVDDKDEALLLTLTYAKYPKATREVERALRDKLPSLASLLIQDTNQQRMELLGPGSVTYKVGDFAYRVSHLSFFQVNRFLVGEMAKTVSEMAGAGELAFDVFAGAGSFSLPLARQFARVIAAEANPVAARDFSFNVGLPENARPGKLEIREMDSADFLRRMKQTPDCVVLDPPRAGLGTEGVAALVRLGPKRIVYVSCDPATLARDLEAMVAAGYEISVVSLFDLFPQTFHIETLVQLVKR
jgi:23S rRNA (uracil1939-C5)-methyltransferase